MLCQNCGENEANIRYTQIINGVKKEMALCNKCAHEFGIGNIDFSMPINFSSFLGDFFDEEKELMPSFIGQEKLKCEKCGMTYEEFIDIGEFGCKNCYETFVNKIDPILKNIHGGNRHLGRGCIVTNNSAGKKSIEFSQNENVEASITSSQKEKADYQNNKLKQLQNDLKIAIEEERYEDAAKIRDEIKRLEVGS